MKKLLVLSGSNSSNSINTQLATYAASILNEVETTIIDLKEFNVPIYNTILEKENGIPEQIQQLFQTIQNHDGFIIASPEHNGLMPAVFKNVIDWLSRINMKFLNEKPVFLMSTSPGGFGGANNLRIIKELLPWWGGQVSVSYSLGKFFENFKEGKIITEENDKLINSVKIFENDLKISKTKAA